MAIDREKARAAGYTDEEIDAYEAEQAQAQPQGSQPPPPPPPDTNQGQAGGTSMGEIGGTMLAAAGPFGLGVAAAAAAPLAYKGGKLLYQGAKNMVRPGSTLNPIGGGGPGMPQMGGSTPTRVPITTGPVSPVAQAPAAAPAPAAAQSTAIQRGMDYARQMQKIAAEKVISGARAAAPVASAAAPAAVGLGALTFSSGLNQGEDEELRRRRAMAATISR